MLPISRIDREKETLCAAPWIPMIRVTLEGEIGAIIQREWIVRDALSGREEYRLLAISGTVPC